MKKKRVFILCLFFAPLFMIMGCGNKSNTRGSNVQIIFTDLNFDSSPDDIINGMGRDSDRIDENAIGGKTYSFNYTGALEKDSSRITYNFDGKGRLCYIDWDYQASDYEDYSTTMETLKGQLTSAHGNTVNEEEAAFYWLDNGVNIRLFGIEAGSVQVIHCTYYEPSYFAEWQGETQ